MCLPGDTRRVTRRVLILLPLAILLGLLWAGSAQALNLSRLVAPASSCPGQTDAHAPAADQEQAMRCMTNYARSRARLRRLDDTPSLDTSATRKSDDIVRCDSFSHFACGRDFTYWMKRTGYLPANCWRAGENIAWGSGTYASVRSIFFAWIHSPGHRENILSPSFDNFGVGLDVGRLEGHNAHVWTQHFGDHC